MRSRGKHPDVFYLEVDGRTLTIEATPDTVEVQVGSWSSDRTRFVTRYAFQLNRAEAREAAEMLSREVSWDDEAFHVVMPPY